MGRTEDYDGLRGLSGDAAYRYLRRGGRLRVWRRTSPHNWFIENRHGETLWHVGEDRRIPDLRLFEIASESSARICSYWGSDSGMPDSCSYTLRRPPPPDSTQGEIGSAPRRERGWQYV